MRLSAVSINMIDHTSHSGGFLSKNILFQICDLTAAGLPIKLSRCNFAWNISILAARRTITCVCDFCIASLLIHYWAAVNYGLWSYWGRSVVIYLGTVWANLSFLTASCWEVICHAIWVAENLGHLSLAPFFLTCGLAHVPLQEGVVTLCAFSSSALTLLLTVGSSSLKLLICSEVNVKFIQLFISSLFRWRSLDRSLVRCFDPFERMILQLFEYCFHCLC